MYAWRIWAVLVALHAVLAASIQVSVFPDIPRPEQHPRYGTTLTRPPTWSTFKNRTQFATLRSFNQDANFNIEGYQDSLSNYSQLGDVIWPVWQTILAPNFANVTAYLAANGFYMTDLWGYVPGSGPGPEMWQAFTPPPENLQIAEQLLGDRWLGMDVGEQDGRYVGGYANQHAPLNAPGIQQRAFFEEHFQAMYSQLGGRVVALQSLTFAHAMAQSGAFTVVGCESGQALVNAQLFYAVARGASKQYGTLYFGNVSVYNRFGYKHYPSGGYGGTRIDDDDFIPPPTRHQVSTSRTALSKKRGPSNSTGTLNYTCSNQGEGGPQCGTSLSLMAKLMFAQIFYNSGYVSFENSWFVDGSNTLSPIGDLQIAAETWLSSFGSPGTHMATIGIIVDYAAGWTSPRNLYEDYNEGDLFYVWGNLPYSPTRGDYLTDSLLRLIYPNYQDSSYFHNETGFSSPTPFGDSLDFLLSDAPAWLLGRYDTLLLAGTPQTEPGLLRSKIEASLSGSTNVMTWAGPLGAWGAAGLANCSIAESEYAGQWTSRCKSYSAGTVVTVSLPEGGNTTVEESASFISCTLQCTGTWIPSAVAWVGSVPVAWAVTAAGVSNTLTVFGSPFGAPTIGIPVSEPGVDASLLSPYPLLGHVSMLVNAALSTRALFSVPGLTFTVCRIGPSNSSAATGVLTAVDYTLLVSNPTLEQAPLSISSNIGDILLIDELPSVPVSLSAAVGYLPDGFAGADLGYNSNTTIAGVATRTFRVVVDESDTATAKEYAAAPSTVRVLPTAPPPHRPLGFALNLRDLSGLPVATLRAAALSFPSLAQTFDTLVVDWAYLHRSDTAALVAEAKYLAQTGVTGAVDFTSGLNLFPTLRLCNNSAPEYANSLSVMTDVLTKTSAMGWSHALLSLHRTPENNMDEPTAMALEAQTIREYLAVEAAAINITLHLRNVPGKSPVSSLSDLLTFIAANDLNGTVRPAPGLAGMVIDGDNAATLTDALSRPAGPSSIAFVSSACPAYDPNAPSRWWADSAPASVGSCTSAPALQALISTACKVGICVSTTGVPTPEQPRVVLVVDAYIGANAFSAPLSQWDTPAQNPSGASLDLAYAEAAWLLQSAMQS